MKKNEKIAIFAAGCFWHVEDVFLKVSGVIKTRVGYTGGTKKNPSYEEVSGGKTGHAEAIEITYNPNKVTYEALLDIFWKIHDPTTLNRQGADIGSNYRSAIFYNDLNQKNAALKSKIEQQIKISRPIVTEIRKSSIFYVAEEYHQKYFQKNKNFSCKI